jgi:hypothetical protein
MRQILNEEPVLGAVSVILFRRNGLLKNAKLLVAPGVFVQKKLDSDF